MALVVLAAAAALALMGRASSSQPEVVAEFIGDPLDAWIVGWPYEVGAYLGHINVDLSELAEFEDMAVLGSDSLTFVEQDTLL